MRRLRVGADHERGGIGGGVRGGEFGGGAGKDEVWAMWGKGGETRGVAAGLGRPRTITRIRHFRLKSFPQQRTGVIVVCENEACKCAQVEAWLKVFVRNHVTVECADVLKAAFGSCVGR